MHVMFEDYQDPAFRFEGLLRTVFNNCQRYGDPFGYAAQDFYINFVPKPKLLGKRALSTTLCKLIIENPEFLKKNELLELEDSIWAAETQEEIIKIIDKAIVLVKLIEG